MRLGALFSGGKDSALAMYLAQQQGHEIACLGSMQTESKDSYMFHYPNFEIVKLQAGAMDIPLVTGTTKGEKEKELWDLKKLVL